MSIKVTSSNKNENKSCPYCKGDMNDSDLVKTCEPCQTSLHEDCARELGRCTTIGCEQAFHFSGEPRVRVKEKGTRSLAAATIIQERAQGFQVSSTGFQYSIFLTVMWTIYLTIVIGELVVYFTDVESLLENASMYFFVWGLFGALILDLLTQVIADNSSLDRLSGKWAWQLAFRVMAAGSLVAYPIGAVSGSVLGTRAAFCIVAFIAYFFFLERMDKVVEPSEVE